MSDCTCGCGYGRVQLKCSPFPFTIQDSIIAVSMKRSSTSPEPTDHRTAKRHRGTGNASEEENDVAYVPYVPLKERRKKEVSDSEDILF